MTTTVVDATVLMPACDHSAMNLNRSQPVSVWPDGCIFPVCAGKPETDGEPWQTQAVVGTAFAVGDRVVTCWHILKGAAEAGLEVGLTFPDGGIRRFVPVAFERSSDGHDLAIGELPWTPEPQFSLSGDLHEGLDVYSYGYPLTQISQDLDGERTFKLGLKLFKGYVVSATALEFPGYPVASGLELDMPAPGGMSGAPLLRDTPGSGGTRDVVGVIQGTRRVDVDGSEDVRLALAYGVDPIAALITNG